MYKCHDLTICVLFTIVAILWTLCRAILHPEFMIASLVREGICESVIETTNMVDTKSFYRCHFVDASRAPFRAQEIIQLG